MAKASPPRDGDDEALAATDTSEKAIAEALDAAPDAEVATGPRVFEDLPPPPPAPPEPPPVRETPAPRSSGPGAMTLILAGVVAAAAGFALSRAVPDGWPSSPSGAIEARFAAQEAEIARLTAALSERAAPPDLQPLADSIGALQGQVEAVEAAVAAIPPPAEAPQAPAFDDPGPRLAALEATLNELQSRLLALESLPPGAAGGDPATAAQLARDLAALRADLAAQKDGAAAAASEVAAAAEAARAALAQAQAEAAALKAETEGALSAARRDAALGRIAAAVDSGAPFAAALAALEAAGTPAPDALRSVAETGAPTLLSLQAAFPEAARAALEASLMADLGDTTMERIGTFLRTQSGARSLEPREGGDPDAVLSRAEAKVATGDIAGAVAEVAALPAPGQEALAGWTALARQRLDAAAAVAALAAAP